MAGQTHYNYDVNGNLTERRNDTNVGDNIYSITYNHVNLPVTMIVNNNVLKYTYDAEGRKLRKEYGSNIFNDYINGIHYENNVFAFLTTDVGRVIKNGSGQDPLYTYEYTLTDHLGNGRVYFDIFENKARKIQETEYYTFGLGIQTSSLLGSENKYQYNGKEKQDELKMFDYGARLYDPVIGRWNAVDPRADDDEQDSWTPYHYGFNNPVKNIDPDGKVPLPVLGFLIGAGVDYGFQVAGNFAKGMSGFAAFKEVDRGSIIISALAGAASGGMSAIGGKTTQFAISTTIDATESIAKQTISNGTASISQTVSDVVSNKIGGAISNKLDGALGIKTAERQLSRAERVSARDPSSSGRAKAVNEARSNLNNRTAIKNVAGGVASNTVQNTSNIMRADFKAPVTRDLMKVNSVQDDTNNEVIRAKIYR